MANSSRLDWVFVTLPKVAPTAPLVGPAILKAILESSGFSCRILDLNLELFHLTKEKHSNIWLSQDQSFAEPELFHQLEREFLAEVLDNWAQRLVDLEARFIGLSYLSYLSRWIGASLARRIRALNPEQKIVMGGPFAHEEGPRALEAGLIDFYFAGEAESNILPFTKGEPSLAGVNSAAVQITQTQLEEVPPADYTDVDPAMYLRHFDATGSQLKYQLNERTDSIPLLYITASRGCVRRCSFCDVELLWPKFRWKSGERVAQEIEAYLDRYRCRRFYFTDSLINGNSHTLKELTLALIDLQKRKKVALDWQAQFICRNLTSFPPAMYDLMKAAGCTKVFVGVESGSESVREHMQKKFSNAEFFQMLTELYRCGIKVVLMYIVGYPTETERDFQMTLEMLDQVAAMGYPELTHVTSAPSLVMIEGTRIWQMRHELGIDFENSRKWTLAENSPQERQRRYQEFCKRVEQLGFNFQKKTLRRAPLPGDPSELTI